ncbi:hypothetical protein AAMO2058_000174200 [Amorphochlora amoebiformis]
MRQRGHHAPAALLFVTIAILSVYEPSRILGRGVGKNLKKNAPRKSVKPVINTKDLQYFAKRKELFKKTMPDAFTVTPEERRQAHLKTMRAKEKFGRQDPLSTLFKRIPLDTDNATLRVRDFSDSEYEGALVKGFQADQFYKQNPRLPNPRMISKKIRKLPEPKKWKPWDIIIEEEKRARREEATGEKDPSRKLPKKTRLFRRRLERAIKRRKILGFPDPHPGTLLRPEPRAHAELLIQIADHEAKRDPQVAFEWYKSGAKIGSVNAMFKLGCHYANGEEPVDLDTDMALQWFQKAADLGHVRSKHYLGLAHLLGNGRPKNFTAAFQYFSDAAESGDNDAKSYVGYMYEEGKGRKKDEFKAIEIYRDAAKNGHRPSRDRLKQLERAAREQMESNVPKNPSKHSQSFKFGGGKEKEERAKKKEHKEVVERRALKREQKKAMKRGEIESTDPDDWDEDRKEAARFSANRSIEREINLEARAKEREQKKRLKSERGHLPPAFTSELPPVLLPGEIDGTIRSANKVWFSGRYDPTIDFLNMFLENGVLSRKEITEFQERFMKSKSARKKPRFGRYYKEELRKTSSK